MCTISCVAKLRHDTRLHLEHVHDREYGRTFEVIEFYWIVYLEDWFLYLCLSRWKDVHTLESKIHFKQVETWTVNFYLLEAGHVPDMLDEQVVIWCQFGETCLIDGACHQSLDSFEGP